MTDTPVAVARSGAPRSTSVKYKALFLVTALACVLGFRLLLYTWNPDLSGEFDVLYLAAAHLLGGQNPYVVVGQSSPLPLLYPLPAVLLAIPFTALPLAVARPIFDILVGWTFVYALWRHRGPYALLAIVSGAYLFAVGGGQSTPLMVAAGLVPVLGFLLAVKPTTSVPLWISRPSRAAVLAVGAFLILSLLVLPSWPRDWWIALQQGNIQVPPIVRPFGFILLLAALRWRSPEGRLILAIAFIPQNTLPHELVSLALIPSNLLEMGIYVAGTWIALLVAADQMHLSRSVADWTVATWPATLGAVYLPMLYLVLRPLLHLRLRRPSGGERGGQGRSPRARTLEKERRRPNRLDDRELKVDVAQNVGGGFTAKVTHLPTQQFTIESAQTRESAVRKAQDKLAGIIAGMRREKKA
jgi:hypothetical protein